MVLCFVRAVIEASNAVKLHKKIDDAHEEMERFYIEMQTRFEENLNRIAYREGECLFLLDEKDVLCGCHVHSQPSRGVTGPVGRESPPWQNVLVGNEAACVL